MPDSAGGPEGQPQTALLDASPARHADFQEQLHQAQKMEAIGQLSAGIAHHFNNMLMGILPNVKLAAGRAPPELAPLLRDAEQAAVRAAEMVKQLSAFAGPGNIRRAYAHAVARRYRFFSYGDAMLLEREPR